MTGVTAFRTQWLSTTRTTHLSWWWASWSGSLRCLTGGTLLWRRLLTSFTLVPDSRDHSLAMTISGNTTATPASSKWGREGEKVENLKTWQNIWIWLKMECKSLSFENLVFHSVFLLLSCSYNFHYIELHFTFILNITSREPKALCVIIHLMVRKCYLS